MSCLDNGYYTNIHSGDDTITFKQLLICHQPGAVTQKRLQPLSAHTRNRYPMSEQDTVQGHV